MVKGISKQVIVLHSPDEKMFEQAIFILKDGHKSVSDADLLKEAKRLMSSGHAKRKLRYYGPVWAFAGALVTGVIWLITFLI